MQNTLQVSDFKLRLRENCSFAFLLADIKGKGLISNTAASHRWGIDRFLALMLTSC